MRSSAGFSDFLLNFVFAGSAFDVAPCAKRDAMDESRTAIACVNFPGFIVCFVSAPQNKTSCVFFYFIVHEDADARQSRRDWMRLKK
jgi:hypothetical protein